MKNITYVRYSPATAPADRTGQLVECYRNVFADGPWHEWLKCPKCNKYWGVRDATLLSSWKFHHCNATLVEFWPREQVTTDLRHEITESTSCWLALEDGDNVIGFCWGYPIATADLEKKLGVPFATPSTPERVAYQDEVGVLSEYRRHGIAKTMVKHRSNDFEKQNLKYRIVRTREKPEPSVTFLWYMRLGFKILARYSDGRVILGSNL